MRVDARCQTSCNPRASGSDVGHGNEDAAALSSRLFCRRDRGHASQDPGVLATHGFNAYVAGQIAASAISGRLAAMPTLDWKRRRDHGRRSWTGQLKKIYGTLYILDTGCGRKSWNRWKLENHSIFCQGISIS